MNDGSRRTTPKDGAESVWDFPRPPAVQDCAARIRVEYRGKLIVDASSAKRVLETSHPPSYYVPPADIAEGVLIASERRSFCEYKGVANYFDVVVGDVTAKDAAWSYPKPTERFASIRDHVAFYAHLMDACYVDEELVQPQAGGFYGGWVTSKVAGPFKGARGTERW